MNNDNVFYLLVAIVFDTVTQIGGIVPKAQDLAISFQLIYG